MSALLLLPLFLFPAHAHAHGVETVVEMRNDGFYPKEATIAAGTSIVFKNVSDEPYWPASNIHPTHTLYPGSDIDKCGTETRVRLFDACAPIMPGESYEFTFEHPGTWKYHDHLRANRSGTVVVEGEATAEPPKDGPSFFMRALEWAQLAVKKAYYALMPGAKERLLSRVSTFTLASGKTADDEGRLTELLSLAGPHRVMQDLLSEAGAGSLDCHQQAHHIGRIAYGLYGGSAFAEKDATSCSSGFYHGAMETFLAEEGTDSLVTSVRKICEGFGSLFGEFECLHGAGHGVMAYESYDLPAALQTCGQFTDDWGRRSCYGGVFMENIIAAQGTAGADHTTEWISDDPHYPCNSVAPDEAARYECYQIQTSWMLTLASGDFKKVAAQCQGARASMVPVCYQSYGRDAAGAAVRDPQKIQGYCAYVPGRYYDDCIRGAVNVIVDYWGPNLRDEADRFCAALPESRAAACMSVVSERKAGLAPR
jgi:plastocyanin